MPAALSYPGVYIDEIPSGVRTITGVPTAICAFLGRSLTGPDETPVTLNSFGDFERIHGGLSVDYPVSYAVRDFFLNGGAQAVMVRLYGLPQPSSPPGDGTAKINISIVPASGAPELSFRATSPGAWANNLRIKVIAADPAAAQALGFPPGTEVFNIEVEAPDPNNPGAFILLERVRNLTFADTSRRLDRVLVNESAFIVYSGVTSLEPPLNPNMVLAKYQLTNLSPPGPRAYTIADAGGAPGADSQKLSLNDFIGSGSLKTGINALDKTDIFNLLCIPPDDRNALNAGNNLPIAVNTEAAKYCAARRAVFIADPPNTWNTVDVAAAGVASIGISGLNARNAAIYYPRVLMSDPLRGGQLDTFVACGAVAGAIASTDARRGVFKAPAGIDVALVGVRGLSVKGGTPPFSITDAENGTINPVGINAIRVFPVIGPVIWGARTLRGADQLADDYKYLPVRRIALFIEESLFRGTKFAVFEPNDEPLWAQIRLNVGAFMQGLFRQGAFQGQTPSAAYFVKCDKETTTQSDINLGIVNIIVGFAPLKPAEFVVIKIQQIVGQIAT
jgi:uncharacterized protein